MSKTTFPNTKYECFYATPVKEKFFNKTTGVTTSGFNTELQDYGNFTKISNIGNIILTPSKIMFKFKYDDDDIYFSYTDEKLFNKITTFIDSYEAEDKFTILFEVHNSHPNYIRYKLNIHAYKSCNKIIHMEFNMNKHFKDVDYKVEYFD